MLRCVCLCGPYLTKGVIKIELPTIKEGHAIYMKRRRIEAMKEKIKKAGNCPKNRFLSEFELDFGVSKRKASEYLNLLVAVDYAKLIKAGDIEIVQYVQS